MTKFFYLLFLLVTSLSPFHFAKAEANNPIVVITDVLDDDIRAIVHGLLDPKTSSRIKAFLVSTGNVQLKSAVLKAIVNDLGFSIPVFVGTSTDLASNPVTSFAAKNTNEGLPILSYKDVEALKKKKSQDGRGSIELAKLIKDLNKKNEKLDIVLLTAPTDLVSAINIDKILSRTVLANLFTMGLYKKNNSGELIAPYNTMADPSSVIALLDLYQTGIFQKFFHIPSDTIQLRTAGLAGGYFPENEMGNNYKLALRTAMKQNPGLERILNAAMEYGSSWIHSAIQQFGIGFNYNDRWVPDSFKNPGEASGFYLADIMAMVLAGKSVEELRKLDIIPKSILGPEFGANLNRPFNFRQTEGPRKILDINALDGSEVLKQHISLIENAVEIKPFIERVITEPSKALKQIEKDGNYTRANKAKKALVIVFKNSPDDWFALLRLASTKQGLQALEAGGIITEGFNPQEMKSSLIKVLNQFGIQSVPVASGFTYGIDDVSKIPNFKGELAFVNERQDSRAFTNLPNPEKGINNDFDFTAESILERATVFSEKNAATIDMILLGEGLDIIRTVKENPKLAGKIANLYVMGGGRIDQTSGQFTLSRNWLPHKDEVLKGLESLGNFGKKLFIFSSDRFGGSIVSSKEENVGNGKVAFSSLIEGAEKNLGLKAVLDHWTNWTRTFSWVMNPSKTPTFDPNTAVNTVTTSPLGLVMAEQWLAAELESNNSKNIQLDSVSLVSLVEKGISSPAENSGIKWLRPTDPVDVSAVASRFGLSLSNPTFLAKLHNSYVRVEGFFSKGAERTLLGIQNENRVQIKCIHHYN